MKPTKDAWCIQIDVTNKCYNKCSNCTHLITYAPKWEMPVIAFNAALWSLKDWPGLIGVIGGDPMLHSQFDALMECFIKNNIPRERRGLWTSNFRGREKEMREFFGYINYNPHNEKVLHTPVLCASQDIIKDPVERRRYIDNCWLAEKWSPSITPKGVYRCEVMGSMDMALNLNLGLPVSLNWWARPLKHFENQIEAFCNLCGICLPLEAREDKEETDDVTKSTAIIFHNKPPKTRNAVLHNPEEIKFTDDKEPYRYIERMKTK